MVSTVTITGRGVLSPWGTTFADFSSGVCEKRSALRVSQGVSHGRNGPVLLGEVGDFAPNTLLRHSKGLREFDRTALLLSVATALALADSQTELNGKLDSGGLAVGSTFGPISSIVEFDTYALREGPTYVSPLAFPNTVLNAPVGRMARLFGIRGVNATLATGETSGLDALIYATEWLRRGQATCVLAGSGFGLSTTLCDCIPGPLGEGAGMFLLETPPCEGARVYVEVAGFATAFLPQRLDGVALAASAMRRAIHAAQKTIAEIDVIVAGGRSPEGSPGLEETVMDRVFCASMPTVCSLTELTGDCLDANGAFQIAAGLLAIQQGAQSVLLSGYSRSGHSSFVVLSSGGAM